MFRTSNFILAVGCAGLLTGGCTERSVEPTQIRHQAPEYTVKPGDPGAAADRIVLQAHLASTSISRAQGQLRIEIVGGYLVVSLHAAGLEPLQRTPQHIHVNPTCSPGGGILINLDENLTVAGEAPSVGAAYPMSSTGGVVNYYASRSLEDLLTAVNTNFGANLTSVEALLTWLDFENRNAHMHIPVAPFTPVNCGEITRVN